MIYGVANPGIFSFGVVVEVDLPIFIEYYVFQQGIPS